VIHPNNNNNINIVLGRLLREAPIIRHSINSNENSSSVKKTLPGKSQNMNGKLRAVSEENPRSVKRILVSVYQSSYIARTRPLNPVTISTGDSEGVGGVLVDRTNYFVPDGGRNPFGEQTSSVDWRIR